MMPSSFTPRWLERFSVTLFKARRLALALFLLLTAFFGWQAAHLRIDAGFEKYLPIHHPYMETFRHYASQFNSANRLLVVLKAEKGDMFTPEFFTALKGATDDVFFIKGVDRARVMSLYTPNVRFTEVVEDGFSGGNIIPADFDGSRRALDQVRSNVLKSNYIGRLVAQDFSAAAIAADLLERDPSTGAKIDYQDVARQLEEIRAKYTKDGISVHIIGFAQLTSDIAAGAKFVATCFVGTLLLTLLLAAWYAHSWRAAFLLVGVACVAVIWQFGVIVTLGYGIDPMSILLPFLIFAIGVSHGTQMITRSRSLLPECNGESREAARLAFAQLLIPGTVALSTDLFGFLFIMMIAIPVIRELAVAAAAGVVVIMLTNLFLLPLLLSYGCSTKKRPAPLRLLMMAAGVVKPSRARLVVLATVLLFGLAIFESRYMVVGDSDRGSPELWPNSRYNQDVALITSHFDLSIDILTVMVEGPANACIDPALIRSVDRFSWAMQNVEGVHAVLALPSVMKIVNAGWSEGYPGWRELPRDSQVLVRAVTPVDTSTGLLNADCSVMPVQIFLDDHKTATLDRVVDAVKAFSRLPGEDKLTFRLATGAAGVMAAGNDAVRAAHWPMLLGLYGALILLCLLTFRSVKMMLAVMVPLALVSLMANAFMALFGIGLKSATLPVAALGVGIGVDYGIYLMVRLVEALKATKGDMAEAYRLTLSDTGRAVAFTGLSLAAGVLPWLLSPLKYQADMGILLAFMFLFNMLGALLILPALLVLLARRDRLS